MSNIRVTYSGLIGFIIGISSIFTGFLFTLIITRSLSQEEYGTWAIIGSIIAYFLVSERIFSLWTLRQISRGDDVGKTSVTTSFLMSLGIVPLYLLYVFFISSKSNADLIPMFFGVILLPVYFLSQTLSNINLGHKPQAVSYSLIVFELLKVPLILLTVYIFELGIQGAIIALFIAYVGRLSFQFYFARTKLKAKFQKELVKKWFKLSWIPLYGAIWKYIWASDVVVITLLTGSVIGIAIYHVSLTIALISTYSKLISQALYSKLVANGNIEYIQKNFTLILYFSIPLLGISIIFSKPALFALNPIYQDASTVVILLSIKSFFSVYNLFYYSVLGGLEKADLEENPKFSTWIKSQFFFVPTLQNVHALVYLASLISIVITLNLYSVPILEIITVWALIAFVLEIPIFIYLTKKIQKSISFKIPYIVIGKYILATSSFMILYVITSPKLITYEISIYDFIPGLIAQFVLCVSVFLLVTYILDKNTKELFKMILQQIKN